MLLSCDTPSTADILLENAPGDKYAISYDKDFGLFVVTHEEVSDTLSLLDNWLYALYRFRQQEGDLSKETSYDDFLKSPMFCLPGSEQQFVLLNEFPDSAFTATSDPQICDCITEDGAYDLGNVNCEEKFQVFRSSFYDSLSWHFSFYRDVCRGGIDSTMRTYNAYRDSAINRGERAEKKMKRLMAIQDSIDNSGPKHQCSGTNWVPKHARSSSFRSYEQCRAMTSHVSGRCSAHR